MLVFLLFYFGTRGQSYSNFLASTVYLALLPLAVTVPQ